MTTGKIKIDPYATSHPINEGTSYIPVNFQKSKGQPGGHLKPHDTRSTRLQELSLMNSTYFGNIHYDIHLDMKLDYTISRIFQESIFPSFFRFCHQAELERYQGHIKLDEKYPYNGAHGRLTYDIHDKHWIPHIGINNPSNYKADTKNKGYQEIIFFDWKIQLEKIQIDPYATSHPINEGTSYIPVNFQKSKGQPGGHLKPHDTRSTRLQELSLMNSTYFGNIHYDIHLDMKLDYTISRIFQEMSLSELETLHQLCELERTQILQSLALAVLKIPYAGYLLSGNRSNFLDYEGNILWFYTCTKKVSPLYVFEDKRCYKRIPIFYKNKVHFVDTLSRRTYFWDTAVPCGSENSHNVVQLNPDEDKYYLLTPYPTLMQSLKKFSPESIRAIARNPNIDLQSIGIYSKSDIQHHIRTQQFQELLTQMDTIQRQSIDQNLRKLAETAGFADIYTQDYSGYFKDIKDYIYLNG